MSSIYALMPKSKVNPHFKADILILIFWSPFSPLMCLHMCVLYKDDPNALKLLDVCYSFLKVPSSQNINIHTQSRGIQHTSIILLYCTVVWLSSVTASYFGGQFGVGTRGILSITFFIGWLKVGLA